MIASLGMAELVISPGYHSTLKQDSTNPFHPHTRMKMRVNPAGDFLVDARCRLQVAEARHLHAAGRAEMVQQCSFAGRADPLNLVQFTLPDGLRTARPMRGDGETMRLVADALQEVQDRIARR